MNKEHLAYCAGPEWAALVRDSITPWVTRGLDLGDSLLEVGPGPGATTVVLCEMVPHLTSVELDEALASQLTARTAGKNVTVKQADATAVKQADATALPFEDGTFSAAICMTMLHHVPTPELQDRILAEMARAVRPGGLVIGSDNLDSDPFRQAHENDTCVPIDPATLAARLKAAGLEEVRIETNPFAVKFVGIVIPSRPPRPPLR
jgi:ubiquinone/menaquinone biosynthesis C-methylase UbiE